MNIIVKPYLVLRQVTGCSRVVIKLPPGATLQDLLGKLRESKRLPDKISLGSASLELFTNDHPGRDLLILIDGVAIDRMKGLHTVLWEGAVISIFPPAAGG